MDEEEISIYDNYVLEDSEEEAEEDSGSNLSEEIIKEKVIDIRTLKEKIYDKALRTKTPHNMIIQINDKLYSMIELQKNNKPIMENYNFFVQNEIRIDYDDFLLAFYYGNKNKGKEYLIDNFNIFREISKKEKYSINNFNSYKNGFKEKYKYYYSITLEKSKKYKRLMEKIKDLDTIDTVDNIMKSFKLLNSEVNYEFSISGMEMNPEKGKILFDNIFCNQFFPFIKYTGEENYYKIYKKDIKYEYYINLDKNLPKTKNTIYLLMNSYEYKNKFSNQFITIDLEKSTINIQYPEGYLNFIKDKIYELLPDLEYLKQNEKNIKGNFEILFPGYNDFKIYYMTLFDNIMSEFLFIREENSVRSLKENLKFYYVGTNISKKNLNYTLFFNIENIQGDKYLLRFKSKVSNPENIKEFITILQKLIYYYNQDNSFKYLEIIKTPYTGINGSGIGGAETEKKEQELSRKRKKIDNLVKSEPDLFSKSIYVRNCPCPKQPIIIDKEDVKDWENYEFKKEKREVVLFPPEESTQSVKKNYYTCPDDTYKKVSFKENPDKSSNFPVIPCCSINKTNEFLYENYDKISSGKFSYSTEYRGKNTGTLKTYKILFPDRIGLVPEFITNILSPVIDYEIVREGVIKNNKSSFIHCIFKALENIDIIEGDFEEKEGFVRYFNLIKLYNKKENIEEKTNIVKKFRKFAIIGSKSHIFDFKPEILSQELYDYSKEEIEEMIVDNSVFYDSKLFYKILEFYSNINIFVFNFDKNTNETNIEIPNHEYYHNREIKEELSSLILLRHKINDNFDVYELIKRNEKDLKETNNSYLFPPEVSTYMKKIINSRTIYNINTLGTEICTKKNVTNNINWNYILRDYKIVSQILNTSGRAFSITFKFRKKEEEYMTIFIKETFPINVKNDDKIYITSKNKCIKVFGNNYIEGNGGLFYKLNDYERGVFVPCKDVSSSKKGDNITSFQYNIVSNLNYKNREKENLTITKKNASIFKELMLWLYLLDKNNFEDWWSENVINDKNMKKEIFNSTVFKVDYIFPELKNTEEGIKYLNIFLPEIFDKNIYLYTELYENTKLYLKFYLKSKDLDILENKKCLTSILENKKDFKVYKFNSLLISDQKYSFWKNNTGYEKKNYFKIEECDIDLEYPFIWNNPLNNKIYYIKNNKDHLLNNAIVICYFWKFTKRVENISEKISLWRNLSILDKKNDKKEIAGWDFNNLKDYVEEITSKKYLFTEKYQYFDILDSLNIDFKLGKDYSYIVYSNVNEKIEIHEKYIVDDLEPFEIYIYQEGGYASMLDVV